jgi:hypothetical protein
LKALLRNPPQMVAKQSPRWVALRRHTDSEPRRPTTQVSTTFGILQLLCSEMMQSALSELFRLFAV